MVCDRSNIVNGPETMMVISKSKSFFCLNLSKSFLSKHVTSLLENNEVYYMGCCIRYSGCVVMETLIYVVLRSLKNLTVQLFRYKEFLQTVIQAVQTTIIQLVLYKPMLYKSIEKK